MAPSSEYLVVNSGDVTVMQLQTVRLNLEFVTVTAFGSLNINKGVDFKFCWKHCLEELHSRSVRNPPHPKEKESRGFLGCSAGNSAYFCP